MSLIDDFGSLGLASQLERLSEILKKDAANIFNLHLPGIKYKWYPVIFGLYKSGSISVVELANELSYAHPSIIDILKEMEQMGLIKSVMDKSDNRKRLLSLTAKGNKLMQKILPLTEAFSIVVNELLNNDHHLLKAIAAVRAKLEDEPFVKRVNKVVLAKAAKPQKAKLSRPVL